MTKVNPNNGNKTKSFIFPWDILKSEAISFFYQKILKYFNHFENWEFHSFMTKMIPNNGNETKSDIFPWDIFKSGNIYFFIKKY